MSGDSEMIRLVFSGAPNSDDSDLDPISWDKGFEEFGENDLALLYQETTDGEQSNFNKLVSRNG